MKIKGIGGGTGIDFGAAWRPCIYQFLQHFSLKFGFPQYLYKSAPVGVGGLGRELKMRTRMKRKN